MGAAEGIPGVSGGTVAFITGIYTELVQSIKSIDADAIRLLVKFQFAAFWKKINGNFLTVLLAGIITSLFSLSKLVTYLLVHYPISILSFLFGFILISTPIILHEIKKWNGLAVVLFVLGAFIAYTVTIVSPLHAPQAYVLIFIAGILTTCSIILPGISGSFVLLLIGLYPYIAMSVMQFNIPVIVVFITGCLIGIAGFSRFLTWILDNYHSAAVALLAGVMMGSLNKVWPWREVVEYVTNSRGEQVPLFDKSILPWHYLATTGKDPQVFQAILLMALGVFIVVFLEKISTRLKTKI